jgi:DNA adenine methylase
MPIAHSPLRYPGGKQILARVLGHLIRLNGASGGTYVEPFAGGAGAALALLYGGHVDRIMINDADRCIYELWKAMLEQTDRFVDMLSNVPLTVEEWRKQRDIYRHPKGHSGISVGFATFYLNRCNRSGIIGNGGLIGGVAQKGRWKIDARFNRDELGERIRKVALYRERISLSCLDALAFLGERVSNLVHSSRPFVYLDPPYYAKGCALYLNHYKAEDHGCLATYVRERARFPWVMSYDNVPEIRKFYRGMRLVPFDLNYSARERRVGREVMISDSSLVFPKRWGRRLPAKYITSADDVVIPPSEV